jgi:hypothetical protein
MEFGMRINQLILNIKINCNTYICIYRVRYRICCLTTGILWKVPAEPDRQGQVQVVCVESQEKPEPTSSKWGRKKQVASPGVMDYVRRE